MGFLQDWFGTSAAPSPGQIDPRLDRISREQNKMAEQYRQEMPGIRKQKYNLAEDQARQDLASQMAGINAQMNRRGLLYSGKKMGATEQAGVDTAGQLAQQRAMINQQTQDQSNQMASQGAQSGLALQKMQQDIFDRQYEQALQNRDRKQGVGGLLGSVAGALLPF
jgi:hypothetical protein